MATEVFANNASTTLQANVTTTPAAGTSELWTVASTSLFPSIGTGGTQQFRATIGPTSDTNPEIVICTQINSATTMTVTRGAEGSPIKQHVIGDPVINTLTAALLAAIMAVTHPLQEATFTSSGTWTVPTGVTLINLFLVGGGGSSSGGNQPGGGGQVLPWVPVAVTPGQVLTITIGAGGPAPAGGVTGNNGGNSTVTGTGVSKTALGGIGGTLTQPGSSGGGGVGGYTYFTGGSTWIVVAPGSGGGGVNNSSGIASNTVQNGGPEPYPGFGGGGAAQPFSGTPVGGGTSGGGLNTAGAANTGGGGGANSTNNAVGFAGGSGYCAIEWSV